MAAMQRRNLCDLSFESKNVAIVAIIINKSEPKYFTLKRPLTTKYNEQNQEQQEQQRGVITFTVRDSQYYFTNCKFWGTEEKIKQYNQNFHIGDIIVIILPKIVPITTSGSNFSPLISTPYNLVLNEGTGSIDHQFGNGDNTEELKKLLRLPIKPLNETLNLSDICIQNSQQIIEQFVDLLVIIKHIRPIRNIQSKNNNNNKQISSYECLEVIVIDRSFINGIILTIWNTEWIKRATQNWKELQTILHLIDVQVRYSDFYKTIVLGLSGRTIITENPIGKEADNLLSFVISNSSMIETSNPQQEITKNYLPNPESIKTIMTVRQIYDRIDGNLNDDNDEFTAVLFAMITQFDLDGLSNVISKKCIHCKRYVKSNLNYCNNDQCQMNMSIEHTGLKYEYFFDINVHLTDHTGTLIESRLSNQIAENFLKINTNGFLKLNDEQKTQMKWKYLMERFEIKLVVKKKSTIRKNLAVIIVEMRETNLNEVASKISVY